VKAKEKKGDLAYNSVYENVVQQVRKLKELEPVLSKDYQNKSIKVVGAIYHLDNGAVEVLEETLN